MTAPAPVPTVITRPSVGEQGLWLLHQLVPERGVANVALHVEPAVAVRWWPLREAFQWLVDRHPALRTAYTEVDGEPLKVLAAPGAVEVDVDVMHATAEEREAALTAYAGRPFDVRTAPLVRVGLQAVDGAPSRICLVAAHLAVDAASVKLLLAELRAGYAAICDTGEPPDLPPPATAVPPDPRPASRSYWLEQLAGYRAEAMRLAPAADSPAADTFAADEIVRRLAEPVVDTVSALCRRCRGTEASVLLSAYLLALRSQGADADAVVGVMVSNRTPGTAAVGYHVSTVPLRVRIDPGAGFADLVRTTGAALLNAVEHADVSFEQLVEGERSVSDPAWWRSGLLRQTFNYRPPAPAPTGAAEPVWDVHTGLSRFEVELTFERAFGGLFARLAYSTEVHDESFAMALLDRITAVLHQAAGDAARPVGDLDLRTTAERELADRVNRTRTRWPGPQSLPELVLASAQATPDAPALRAGERSTTYAELVDAAGAVAAALRDAGVRPDEVVAVGSPRGTALAAAVLGTWLAGAVYLPLDPGHPAVRLVHQLDDAGCRVVLDGHLLPPDCRAGRTVLAVGDLNRPGSWTGGATAPESGAPAYLIYTSGSTGDPKGVRLTHGNLANVVRHFIDLLGAGSETAMLWLTTFAFDISALELFLPLACGGTVVVAPDEVRASPAALLELVERAGVNLIQATPTTWRMLLPEAGDRLTGRIALCGGEPMSPALARQLHAATGRAFNVYGPTETTIWSTAAPLGPGQSVRTTVGYPIANTGVHVLDARLRPVPPMLVGELCLAGAGVAAGYHERPELTADRFRTDAAIGRFYRTGDLARQLPDGQIELLGRRDRQVKLRGHRIELGEVEHALAEHDRVAAVSVVASGDPSGADGHLVAFVVPTTAAGATVAPSVWALARDRLPAYCVPGRIIEVAELPRTPNGKIDVAALSRAAESSRAGAGPAPALGADDADAGPGEQALVRAWQEVLGLPGAAGDTNFFLAGGTSLLAVRLAAVAADALAAPVTMGMIFRAPTPAALAALIAELS
ncbi:amino acid adenylation domain-containing protein [Actinoplanes sp. NPDC026619]|uniref:non-ribosomal peptide synthetase n=1 Tax=Actinoplanes sp. NPDC026619 TaxID=3155798 RepID=UPI0033D23CB9